MSQKIIFNPLSGKFDLIDVATDVGVPLTVASGETFVVPANKQLLFETVIDCDGVIDLDGVLAEVT